MKHWLFFLLLIINSTLMLSQTKLKRDTGYIQSRSLNNDALNKFKSEKDFQYKTNEPPQSLWDKFWDWFWWKINQILRTKSGRITFWSVLIILGIALIVFFAIRITGMSKDGLFGRSSKSPEHTLSQTNIHQISFDNAIENAFNSGNYRLAIRLKYLQALKKLSDKGYIEWRLNKTNSNYLSETTGKSFNEMFTRLTLDFEYIWYGEKQISKERFFEISDQFHQFNNQLQ